MRPGWDQDLAERPGIVRRRSERLATPKPRIWLCAGKRAASAGTAWNAP